MKLIVVLLFPILLFSEYIFDYHFFEKNGAVMLLIDPASGKIVKANESAGKFYGYGVAKLETMKIQDINTFTKEQVQEEREKALKENRNYFIFRHKLSNKEVKRVEVFSHPIVYKGKKTLFSIIHVIKSDTIPKGAIKHYNENLEEQVDIASQELLEQEKLINYIIIIVVVIQGIVILILLQNIKKRRKAEDELNKLLGTLEERVEQEIKKTKEQDKVIYEQRKSIAMNELLINLSHQWRQPLNVMSLQAGNIIDILDYEGGDRELINEAVKQIVLEAKGLSNSITLLQSSYKVGSDNSCNVLETFTHVKNLIKEAFEAVGIELECRISKDFSLNIKESDLLEILVALFYNTHEVVKTKELKSAVITVETKEENGKKFLIVEDNAGGFDDSLLPDRMFEPYSTTQFKSRNKGLGLYVIKSIVNQLGGEVEASNIKDGARIEIRVDNGSK